MPRFQHNGVTLYYKTFGKGPPLILTHGVSSDHRQWANQVNCLREYFQVIVWDVRGHGHSPLPQGPVDPEDFNRDLIALMDHLSLDQAVLCGLSMGGHISLQTAIRYPERVKALILIGTPCSNSLHLIEKIAIPVSRLFFKLVPIQITARISANVFSRFNPENYRYLSVTVGRTSHTDFNKIWRAVTSMESKHDLHKVIVPTLIMVGAHDYLTGRQQSFLHRQIAGSELLIVKNAQHSTNLDNPPVVNEAILKFCRKNNYCAPSG